MVFRSGNKKIDIASGLFKRSKKGDKGKFMALLNSIGYRGDTNQAWKDYLSL
jgi:hypothetical protein